MQSRLARTWLDRSRELGRWQFIVLSGRSPGRCHAESTVCRRSDRSPEVMTEARDALCRLRNGIFTYGGGWWSERLRAHLAEAGGLGGAFEARCWWRLVQLVRWLSVTVDDGRWVTEIPVGAPTSGRVLGSVGWWPARRGGRGDLLLWLLVVPALLAKSGRRGKRVSADGKQMACEEEEALHCRPRR